MTPPDGPVGSADSPASLPPIESPGFGRLGRFRPCPV